MMDEMDLVYSKAKNKAIRRINKPGNTEKPWDDFPTEWLEKRLWDEIEEFRLAVTTKQKKKELLDIMNLANFNYLSLSIDVDSKSEKVFDL